MTVVTIIFLPLLLVAASKFVFMYFSASYSESPLALFVCLSTTCVDQISRCSEYGQWIWASDFVVSLACVFLLKFKPLTHQNTDSTLKSTSFDSSWNCARGNGRQQNVGGQHPWISDRYSRNVSACMPYSSLGYLRLESQQIHPTVRGHRVKTSLRRWYVCICSICL